MAEREEVMKLIEKAEMTIDDAKRVYEDSMRVQPGDPETYYDAQSQLEALHNEFEALLRVATPEQRDQLMRKQQQLRQLQNQMIVRHEEPRFF